MNTPIYDFVRKYADSDTSRLHMPGHKGRAFLGCEAFDITEIDGADSLYEADGIIKESEKNASSLFGCDTFYSTEGSSHCIRAMMHLITMDARAESKKPLILAGRNAHKTFLSAAALLDFDVQWIYPDSEDSYLTCSITATKLDAIISEMPAKPTAVYITSPDYLGNTADINSLAEVCHKYGVLLAVDNAHGAYLRFLGKSEHPIDNGADICCSSAHKTLPVLTGGAYLHISPNAPKSFSEYARTALSLFGSTSPSYLILQSLDLCNRYLSDSYSIKLRSFISDLDRLKSNLIQNGYVLVGNEAVKITINAKERGYTGKEIADILTSHNIYCEFSDPDYITFMFTPEIGSNELDTLGNVLCNILPRPAIKSSPAPKYSICRQVMSIRDALLSPAEILPVCECKGRVLASAAESCPPAVPILICGEEINEDAINAFRYYGIEYCSVVKK